MNRLLSLAFSIVRLSRKVRSKIKLASLRLRGVTVDSTALIDPAAIFELSGGKITIGPRTFIDRGVILRAYGGNITISSDCSVNAYTIIHGNGGVNVCDGVRIASHVKIIASNHLFSDKNRYIYSQGESFLGIYIGPDVWIGAGATVLDGVTISSGSVIGAGGVVSKSTEPFSINVGVPVRKIGQRK